MCEDELVQAVNNEQLDSLTDDEQIQEPLQIFEAYVDELNTERSRRTEVHRAFIDSLPRNPNVPRVHGSVDVFEKSMELKGAVELAKRLGIIAKDAESTDYLR